MLCSHNDFLIKRNMRLEMTYILLMKPNFSSPIKTCLLLLFTGFTGIPNRLSKHARFSTHTDTRTKAKSNAVTNWFEHYVRRWRNTGGAWLRALYHKGRRYWFPSSIQGKNHKNFHSNSGKFISMDINELVPKALNHMRISKKKLIMCYSQSIGFNIIHQII